jgi:hypothetical protein
MGWSLLANHINDPSQNLRRPFTKPPTESLSRLQFQREKTCITSLGWLHEKTAYRLTSVVTFDYILTTNHETLSQRHWLGSYSLLNAHRRRS